MPEKINPLQMFNPLYSCRKYKIPAWQCPQFLFFVMGIIIIGVILITYFVATFRLGDPTLVAFIVLFAGGFLLIIDFIITKSFEKMAEASRMKTEFISIISHQLRAPLTNLRFSLDFLMSGKLDGMTSESKEYLSIVKENTKRMGDLIDNLLTVSKIESGRVPLKKQGISLEKITRDLIAKFRPFAQASNVKISLSVSKNLPDVLADPLWLEQVVENLLDNAIRYTKQSGEIKIDIHHRGEKINFKIQDQGVGIPKADQKFIFEKFFRSENVVRHQTSGSGLGLHITKRFVELSGGKIWFESEEGRGTTFYFSLPALKSE